jgi:hypothetical protein
MHGLLQGVEREQPHRRLDGALGGRRPRLVGQQPRQGLQRHLAEPLSLRDQPLLEERLAHGEAQEEVAAVELGRALERLRCPRGDVPFEGHDVDVDRRGIEAQELTFDPQ